MGTRSSHIEARAKAVERRARLRERFADEFAEAAVYLCAQGALTSVDTLLRASRHQRVLAIKLRAYAALIRVSCHVRMPDPGRART